MKVRSGFVSNSSSASFVVTWQCEFSEEKDRSNFSEQKMVESAVIELFKEDFSFVEDEGAEQEIKEELVRRTSYVGNDVFQTSFFTSMMNGPLDFGDTAAKMLLELQANVCHNCRLLNARVKDES